ncbi:MlaD family protein [Rubripirellula lacrimiformis]|uniref:MlaD family protein n=1 Tax=Rubripirellula lacrimiformis TaxID=1930273 RepID=UPI001C54D689|nr:MlaD family protein [Rubripirellula lacrimiformis]
MLAVCGCWSAKHQGITLVVAFPASADVSPGSPVEYNGTRIGTVGDVELTDDGNIRAELLLAADTTITHALAPVAFPRRAGVAASPVVFSPVSSDELASIYGDDLLTIDSNYQDGEYSSFGRVFDPQG